MPNYLFSLYIFILVLLLMLIFLFFVSILFCWGFYYSFCCCCSLLAARSSLCVLLNSTCDSEPERERVEKSDGTEAKSLQQRSVWRETLHVRANRTQTSLLCLYIAVCAILIRMGKQKVLVIQLLYLNTLYFV